MNEETNTDTVALKEFEKEPDVTFTDTQEAPLTPIEKSKKKLDNLLKKQKTVSKEIEDVHKAIELEEVKAKFFGKFFKESFNAYNSATTAFTNYYKILDVVAGSVSVLKFVWDNQGALSLGKGLSKASELSRMTLVEISSDEFDGAVVILREHIANNLEGL